MAPYLEGTNAEHICVPGFILIGNVIRVCQSDSTFSGVPPMCQRKLRLTIVNLPLFWICILSSDNRLSVAAIQCLPLEEIENGLITYVFDDTPNFDLNAVAIYACNDGFVLVISLGETESRTCVDDLDNDAEGVFNGQAPACIRKWINCCSLACAGLLHVLLFLMNWLLFPHSHWVSSSNRHFQWSHHLRYRHHT